MRVFRERDTTTTTSTISDIGDYTHSDILSSVLGDLEERDMLVIGIYWMCVFSTANLGSRGVKWFQWVGS